MVQRCRAFWPRSTDAGPTATPFTATTGRLSNPSGYGPGSKSSFNTGKKLEIGLPEGIGAVSDISSLNIFYGPRQRYKRLYPCEDAAAKVTALYHAGADHRRLV